MIAPLRRQLASETRILDRERGLVDYVASDQTLDSYNEVILASGWRFDLFSKNAPFVDSHDYSSIEKLLGRVVDFRIEDDRLIETVQWAHDVPENGLARLGWKMTLAGHLRAVSVGFVPAKTLSPLDADPRPYEKRVRELGLEANPPARIYTEHQQIELSACVLGANPNALALARSQGAITDGDLADAGIDPEEAAFLAEVAPLLDGAPASPDLARLRDDFAARFRLLFARTHTPFPTWPDGQRREQQEQKAQDRERAAFLRSLATLLNPQA